MNKTALITGITGQVGSQMADFLIEKTDFEIVGMMRWLEPMDNLYHLSDMINKKERISIYYADLNDYASMQRMLNEIRPDFIYHLAAQSFPKTSFDIPIETLQTNIIGTANLLEIIRQLNESSSYNPNIHICSSSEVYGKAEEGININENTKFHGASPYSISKIGTDYLGRFYAEAYGLKTFITRMGTHSGPRRSDVFFESTLAKQVALIESGFQKPVVYLGSLDSIRTFQDVRDAVRAYYLLSLKSDEGKLIPGDSFNIAGEEAFKLNKVVDIILGMSKVSNIKVEISENRIRPIDANYQMFDNTKIKSVINWKPEISAKKMFQDLLDHWRKQIADGRIPLNR